MSNKSLEFYLVEIFASKLIQKFTAIFLTFTIE